VKSVNNIPRAKSYWLGKNHWSKTDSESSSCKACQDSSNRKQYKAIFLGSGLDWRKKGSSL